MVQIADRISYWVDRICRVSAVGFVAVMLILILFQVVARYIFRIVPVWTEELACWCMVWGGLLGATVAFRMDVDPRLFQPPRHGNRIHLFTAFWLRTLTVIVFLGPVLWHSGRYISRMMGRTAETMGVSLGIICLAIPVMVLVIFVHLTAKIVVSKAGLQHPLPNSYSETDTV